MFYENLNIRLFKEIQDKMDKNKDGTAIVYVTPYIYPSSLCYGDYSRRRLTPNFNLFAVKAIKLSWEKDVKTEKDNKLHIWGDFDVAHFLFDDPFLNDKQRIEFISNQHIAVIVREDFFRLWRKYNGRGYLFTSINHVISGAKSFQFHTNPQKAKINAVFRAVSVLTEFYNILHRRLSSLISAHNKKLPDKISFAYGNFTTTYSKKDKAMLIKLLVKSKLVYNETSVNFLKQARKAYKQNDMNNFINAIELFNHKKFCKFYELINQYNCSIANYDREQFFSNYLKKTIQHGNTTS